MEQLNTNTINEKYAERQLTEQLKPIINEDETNDFDLKPEKQPALSTMKSNLKRLNKMSATVAITNSRIIQRFDKLKIWIDLNKHDLDIGFLFNINESNMFISDEPEKPDTYYAENKRFEKRIDNIINKCKRPQINYELEAELAEYQGKNIIDITDDEINENKKSYKGENKYPNCKVIYRCRKVGLLNVYINNDRLFICLTGKFNWKYKKIDYITVNNIHETLEEVCRICGFYFDINKFIELAGVYLCDVCIDLKIKNIDKYINALSSLFSLAGNRSRLMKFGSHGLKLKSNAKNAGSSLIFYNKGKDIRRIAAIIAGEQGVPLKEILEEYPDDIDETFRLEVQMYKLQDIRVLLDIPKCEDGIVKLIDVLNSQAKPILKRFEVFGAEEETLKRKITLYIDRQEKLNTPKRKEADLLRLLAAERIAELIKENEFDEGKVKAHLLTEYDFNNDKFIRSLISTIKERYWDFLLYRKPKAVKRVIELLDMVQTYYGREAGLKC